MADRTKLDSNFISLVLSVNGRVRPIDLHSIAEPERAGALQAFYQANAALMPLHFDGDVLVKGAGAVSAAPQAAAATPPAEQPVSDYSSAAVATPGSDYGSAAVAAPAADFAPPAPAEPTAPAPDFAPPIPAEPLPVAPDLSSNDFFSIPPASSTSEVPGANPPAGSNLPAEKISFIFWLLPVFLAFLGGIIAYFLVRKLNPKTARAMLLTGIVMTVVFAIAGVAGAVALGMLTIPGL